MTTKAIVMMILILGGVWGGMIVSMAKLQSMNKNQALKEDKY